MKDEYKGFWRYRIEDIRLICKIQNDIFTILVLKVGNRKEVYD